MKVAEMFKDNHMSMLWSGIMQVSIHVIASQRHIVSFLQNKRTASTMCHHTPTVLSPNSIAELYERLWESRYPMLDIFTGENFQQFRSAPKRTFVRWVFRMPPPSHKCKIIATEKHLDITYSTVGKV